MDGWTGTFLAAKKVTRQFEGVLSDRALAGIVACSVPWTGPYVHWSIHTNDH